MAKLWKGDAGKVRRRVLGGIDARMKKRAGESDLGALWTGDMSITHGWTGCKKADAQHNQAVLYATALGVTLEEAIARRDRQVAAMEAAGTPFRPGKGYLTA